MGPKHIKVCLCIITVIGLILSLCACGNNSNSIVPGGSKGAEKSIKAADTAIQSVASGYSLALPEHGESQWISGHFTVCDDTAYFLGDGTEVCVASPDWSDRRELASFGDLSLMDIATWDGALYVLARSEQNEEITYFALELDLSGGELRRWNLTGAGMPEDAFPLNINASDGNIFVLGGGKLCVYEPEGSGISLALSLDTQPAAQMCVLQDGSLIVGGGDAGTYHISVLEKEARALRALNSFDMVFSRMSAGLSRDLYLDDGDGVYGLRLSDSSFEKLFTWSALGINGGGICELSDGRLLCGGSLDSTKPGPLLIINNFIAVEDDKTVAPHTLILATADSSAMGLYMRNAILDWNRLHPECIVEIRDYSVYYDTEDELAIQMKMATDQINGNVPDIYDFTPPYEGAPLPAVQYSYKGLLENLYPYIDADAKLSRSDFLSGVLSSMESDGGLYELVLSYRVLTAYARSQDADHVTGMTYGELLEKSPSATVYSSGSRAEWLQSVTGASRDKLVDYEKNECYFNSGYFVNILKAAKTMNEDAVGYYAPGEDPRDGSDALLFFEDIQSLWIVGNNEGYVMAGLPELGNVVYPTHSLGISAYSQYKDECWQFLCFLLLGGRENAAAYDFSMLKDVMQSELASELHSLEEGGYPERIPQTETAMSDLLDSLETVNSAYRHDATLWQIVRDEAQKYFDDLCTAEDAANYIQQRAALYMGEQYG